MKHLLVEGSRYIDKPICEMMENTIFFFLNLNFYRVVWPYYISNISTNSYLIKFSLFICVMYYHMISNPYKQLININNPFQ